MQAILNFLSNLLALVLSILPSDPFMSYIDSIEVSAWVKYINWLVPVGTFVTIGAAWLVAIAIFYAWQLVLRWAKVVGD